MSASPPHPNRPRERGLVPRLSVVPQAKRLRSCRPFEPSSPTPLRAGQAVRSYSRALRGDRPEAARPARAFAAAWDTAPRGAVRRRLGGAEGIRTPDPLTARDVAVALSCDNSKIGST